MSQLFDDILSSDLDKLGAIINPVGERTERLREGENRYVAVLFMDLKGFTAMGERMHSEDVKHTLDQVLTVFTNSIEKYGGYIDKYEGDLIMALFGSRSASESDTERALLAGLKMLRDLPEVNKLLGTELKMRIGVNTGEVTTGRVGKKREGDFTVYGDAVNLASRMESNAPVDSLMVPEQTRDLVLDRFDFEDLGEIEVKGKSRPVSVFKVLRAHSRPGERWERSTLIRDTRFIGRNTEVRRLLEAWRDCCETPDAREASRPEPPAAAFIEGVAGIGKSRLVREFLRSAGDPPHRSTYARAFGQGPYFLWLALLRDIAGIGEEEESEVRGARLAELFAGLSGLALDDAAPVRSVSVFRLLLDLPQDDPRLSKPDPQTLQALVHVALRRLLESLAIREDRDRGRPLLLVLDDAQWMDEASRDMLRHLLAAWNPRPADPTRRPRLFLLLTSREDAGAILELRSDARTVELPLKPLSAPDLDGLVQDMLSGEPPPEGLLELVESRSGGNPFFAEEWMIYLREQGLLERVKEEDAPWRLAEGAKDRSLPQSLNQLILSRVDRLEGGLKLVLQCAGVIGQGFSQAMLGHVIQRLGERADLEGDLRRLREEQWIRRTGQEDGEQRYVFTHALTAEVCYRTLLRHNQRLIHRLVAEYAEEQLGWREEYYAFLANHYDRGQVEQKALQYLDLALGVAVRDYAGREALKLGTRLMQRCDDRPDLGGTAVRTRRRLAEVHQRLGEWGRARELLEVAMLKAREIDSREELGRCILELGRIHALEGNYVFARKCVEDALKHFESLEHARGIGECRLSLGDLHRHRSEYAQAGEAYENALERFREAEHRHGEARVLLNLGDLQRALGESEASLESTRRSLEICETLGDRLGIAVSLRGMGDLYRLRGGLERSRESYAGSLAIYEELGHKEGISAVSRSLGDLHLLHHDHEAARGCLKRSESLFEELGDRQGLAVVLRSLGNVCRLKGEIPEAEEYYGKSLRLRRELGDSQAEAFLLVDIGDLKREQGRPEEAGADLKEALSIFDTLGHRKGRALALSRIGDVQRFRDRTDEARASYRESLAILEDLGDRRGQALCRLRLADLERESGRPQEAELYYGEAADIFGELKLQVPRAKSIAWLADVLARLERREEAAEEYKRALRLFEELGLEQEAARCRDRLDDLEAGG